MTSHRHDQLTDITSALGAALAVAVAGVLVYVLSRTVSPRPVLGRGFDMNDFATQVERHRRELRVHCYRMMGSYEDAEDMVQETFLRAWRHRESYAGGGPLRAWLYGIATNACLDALRKRRRVVAAGGVEVPWLQPFPDELLDPPA